MRAARHIAWMLAAGCACLCAACLCAGCSSPSDIDTARVHNTSWVDAGLDDPAFDTLVSVIDTQIRFEAVVDTTRTRITRFAGMGLRIALVVVPPDTSDGTPLDDVYSLSANYLDVPATALPLRARFEPAHFVRYIGARIAAAFVLLYRDDNLDQRYDAGEPVFGASEQHLFAWVDGRVSRIPALTWGEVQAGPNKLVSLGAMPPRFKATPDYASSIFIINVRGPEHNYQLPWPWMPGTGTLHTSAPARMRTPRTLP